MKTLKTILIVTLAVSLTPIAMARPGGHRPLPPPQRYHHHNSNGSWVLPVLATTLAVGAIASSVSQHDTVIVEKPSTTVIYRNEQTPSREEIRPDGTRVIYY